jgi:hypothetical protein
MFPSFPLHVPYIFTQISPDLPSLLRRARRARRAAGSGSARLMELLLHGALQELLELLETSEGQPWNCLSIW